MTREVDALAALLAPRYLYLLDFDGPVCDLYAGMSAATAADRLRAAVAEMDLQVTPGDLDGNDPLQVFYWASAMNPMAASEVHYKLAGIEAEAIESATVTPGVEAFFAACSQARRDIAIVSNNSARAVWKFVRTRDLNVVAVYARNPADPTLMKPNPHVIHQALLVLGINRADAVMIGDSESDMQAAASAEVAAIGYANKRGKSQRLTAAGAAAIATQMSDLATAVERSRP